jgi:ABC-type Fe3+/spermidine/putrescine transport system ATPase subunit
MSDGIVLSQLAKTFGDVKAVQSIDLSIDKGEIVTLLGPDGAGRTTTIA